ncbi:coth protein-domain-containing protein [Mucor lusitanicus]|uniref:Coth protein-domain-containing protein n=1 Tax=Mucor circinelloides f. lusitanicus TaxID=29924 RepID=A0A8H4B5R5_MUCCL|nr:coth protein-domain-containing protein [Mucor lusitanicus]
MQITSGTPLPLLVAGVTSVAAAAASNITYNVVSLQPDNQTIDVIIDDQLKKSQLLHTGDAPAAASGYKYAVIDKANPSTIIDQESFTRDPVTGDKTLNEYYGRSWNTMNLTQLPTIMDPLPIIDRIETKLHIDGEIPTIHITGNQSAIDNMHKEQYADVDVKGLSMTYISPHDVQSFDDVTLAIAGFSTRSLPKLSYKVKLSKKGGDLYHYRRFKLRSMAIDISYMREELAYAIAESIGLPTGKYSYARVFFNNQPLGLFGFLDNFKNPWPRNVFNGGQCHRRLHHSTLQVRLSYLGDNVTLYTQQYSVSEDPSSGSANFTRIMDLCKFISEQSNTTSDSAAVDLWHEKIDVTSFLRGIAFEIVTSQSDAYLANGNNYMLYDDLENERLVYSNQDFDISMGTAFLSAEAMHGGNYSRFPGFLERPLTSRLLAVPEFKREIHDLVYNFTRDLVNPDIMNPRIDDLYTFLEQDVAWDKSLPRVGNSTIAPGFDFDQIPFMFGINGTLPDSPASNFSISLKNWLELRSTNLMKFFNETSNQNN